MIFNFKLKKSVAKFIALTGYEISRINHNYSPLRSGQMQKSIEWLKSNNFEVSTILDVGASDGRWSMGCLKAYPDAHYALFEPQRCHSKALDDFKIEFKDKCTVIKKAVGGKTGKIYFDVSDPFGGSLRGSKTTSTEEVDLTTLDSCIEEWALKGPFLLKLDTHGFEIQILKGIEKNLGNCNVLIIEAYNYNIEPESVTFWELCNYLYERGFRPIDLVDIMYRKYDDSLWQMDLVFIKASWEGFKYPAYR
jgi:FkbM family methyltransferase